MAYQELQNSSIHLMPTACCPLGPQALDLLRRWEALPKLYPPPNWRPPPPAGFEGAGGVRRLADGGWRPAGDNDGSVFLRPMTEAELAAQAAAC